MAAEHQLFEVARRTFDTPAFRGMEFIEVEAKSILNHVPGNALPFSWTINPYRGCSHACVYCFARPTHTFMDMNAGRDFETKIVVKVNAPEVLQRELAAPRWKGDHVAMGTATDPYQRAEGRYRLMPRIVGALTAARNPFSILTKGTLILRDLELLQQAAAVAPVSAAFSIGTLDEDAWRRTEPGTPHPRERMAAVAELNRCCPASPTTHGCCARSWPRRWTPVPPTSPRSCSTCGPACGRGSWSGCRTRTRTSSTATGTCTPDPTARRRRDGSSAGVSDRSCARWAASPPSHRPLDGRAPDRPQIRMHVPRSCR
jgi:hypothetical protein